MENKKQPEEKPKQPTVEELKNLIVEMYKKEELKAGDTARFSRCHPTLCPLAWMWPQWHSTPPHVPLYPTNWA